MRVYSVDSCSTGGGATNPCITKYMRMGKGIGADL